MKGLRIVVHLSVLAAGVLVGIGLDWSVPKHRNFTFQVQEWPSADLRVGGGDTISLVGPGGTPGSLTLDFGGLNPCVETQPANPCHVRDHVLAGSYPFICDSGPNTPSNCPDPGIQPTPTPGPLLQEVGFWKTVGMDFRLTTEPHYPSEGSGAEKKLGGTPAATSPVLPGAYVACVNGTTQLQDRQENPLPPITAAAGQKVFWVSASFSMNTANFPIGLCSNENPSGTYTGHAECDISPNEPEQKLAYSVTALTADNCAPQSTNLIIAAPKK